MLILTQMSSWCVCCLLTQGKNKDGHIKGWKFLDCQKIYVRVCTLEHLLLSEATLAVESALECTHCKKQLASQATLYNSHTKVCQPSEGFNWIWSSESGSWRSESIP